MSGRHGNKGIISKILAPTDIPFLQDGTAIDILLNPLGVPSRMNVGQTLECLLGFAGKNLYEHYQTIPFDEMHGNDFSRRIAYKKLSEAKLKTHQNYIFNPNFPGKQYLINGLTGNFFDQPIACGLSYILKLIHLVDKKVHARALGPYAYVSQQPLRGKSQRGGQRIGEMEVWGIEGYGAGYLLQEMLTLKSDDLKGRFYLYRNLVSSTGKKWPKSNTPEAFKVAMRELQALCINTQLRLG